MRRSIRLRWLSVFFVVGLIGVAVVSVMLRPGASRTMLARTLNDSGDPFSLLLVELDPVNPYRDEPIDQEEAKVRLQTLIQLITSPNVLTSVATNPQVAKLSSISRSDAVVETLRDHLVVTVKEGTSLVEVSSEGLPPSEGAIVVNAVVKAFLKEEAQWAEARNRRSIQMVEDYRDELTSKLESLAQSLGHADRLPISPRGPLVDRAVVESDLRDCLRLLRQVRLDRVAIQEAEDQGDASIRSQIEALDRQERLLVEERDRMAASIAELDDSTASGELRRREFEQLLEQKQNVEACLERLSFDSRSADPIIVISVAHPG
jgi:hypothetical protein